MLACVTDAMEQPDFDVVDRALVDVTDLTDYEVQPAARQLLVVHLAGLFTSREGLRVSVIYSDAALGELAAFLRDFSSLTGYRIAEFRNRGSAEVWLS
jgi:hypothetical protein